MVGGDGLPIRATITVPDDHNFDPETGLSTLELPALGHVLIFHPQSMILATLRVVVW